MATDDKIMSYLLELKNLNDERCKAMDEAKKFDEKVNKLHKKIWRIKGLIDKKEISDPVLQYCFHNYEESAFDKIPLVREFISKLKENVGQAILLFEVERSVSNGDYFPGCTIYPKTLYISKLRSPGYRISGVGFEVTTGGLKEFSESEGQWKPYPVKNISLNKFLDEYLFRRDKALIEGDNGLEMVITFCPTYSTIGNRLVIGNKRVRNYMSTLDWVAESRLKRRNNSRTA